MSGDWKLVKVAGVWRVRWRSAGRWRQRSTGTGIRRDAERFLGRLRAEVGAGQPVESAPCSWAMFRDQFERLHAPILSTKGAAAYSVALNQYQALMRPRALADVTRATLLEFRAKLLAKGLEKATASNYVGHVRWALTFARDAGLIQVVPDFPRLKRGEKGSRMKGFALDAREFKQWRQREKRPHVRFMLGLLWLSGLRLGEAISLDWSRGPNRLDLAAKPYPLLRLADQKNGTETTTPLPPDLAAWLERVPAKDRSGPVAKGLTCRHVVNVSELLSESGKRSGVERDGKTPTAHDLRRSFGTRWSRRLLPQELQAMMRHARIETTLRYYVDARAGDLGAAVWGRRRRDT